MSDVLILTFIPVAVGAIVGAALLWYGLSYAVEGYREAERWIRIAKG